MKIFEEPEMEVISLSDYVNPVDASARENELDVIEIPKSV